MTVMIGVDNDADVVVVISRYGEKDGRLFL